MMAFQQRIQKHCNRKNGDYSDLDLSVLGYSSKLHEHSAIDGGVLDEGKYLIPWNGDEQLKIDRHSNAISMSNLFHRRSVERRKSVILLGAHSQMCILPSFNQKNYDARLYLSSLDELNELKGKTNQNEEEEESAEVLAEKLEEELCEEQRYMDFYATLKNAETNEEKKKHTEKKAEIGFNYDQIESNMEENEEKEGIDVGDDEPFQKPESLKLPVGIVTPDTMRQNALIERTASFVVSKGPQMEIVIKAKQRQRTDQFDFLDFDHRLHSYYKYLCKLIREKKYTPNLNATPSRTAKNKMANHQGEQSSSEENESNDDGYLHPLLRGGGEKTTENVGFIGPVKKPPVQKIQRKSEIKTILEPTMHNPLMIDGNAPNESSLYSSLMKCLHALLPKREEKKTSSIDVDEERTEQKQQSPKPTKASNNEEMQFEKDIERINDYNKWHLEFYGRPSPYLPGPPPIPFPPLPDSAVESGITVAAKYVALHGASAEQRLIEHNGDKVHFLLARSPYYTFYQSSVRHLQSKLFQQNQKMQQQISQPTIIPPISLLEQISPLPIRQEMDSTPGNMPIEIKINDCKEEMTTSNLIDKKQQERKEKARLFMERILNERLAEKRKKRIPKPAESEESSRMENEQNELMGKKSKWNSGFDAKCAEIASTSAAGTSSGNFTPSQLSKTISSLIDQQLQKTFASSETTPPTSSSLLKKRKREKKQQKLDTSGGSDYSDSRSENAHRKERKRAKTKKDENGRTDKKSKHQRMGSIDRQRKRKSGGKSSHSSSDGNSSSE